MMDSFDVVSFRSAVRTSALLSEDNVKFKKQQAKEDIGDPHTVCTLAERLVIKPLKPKLV
jgi:hypothetical protein